MNRPIFASLAAFLACFISVSIAYPQCYQFVEIARGDGFQSGSPFVQFQPGTSINDSGRVVFHGNLDSGQAGLFTADGATPTTIVTDDQFTYTSFGLYPSIANNGTVLFRAGPDSSNPNIYGGSGAGHTVFGSSSVSRWFGHVVNLDGLGLLMGGVSSTSELWLADGVSGPTLLYDATNLQNIGTFFTCDINESGSIASVVGPQPGFPWQLVTGNGGPLTTIVSANSLGKLANVSINNSGEVAFGANTGPWGPEELFITVNSVPVLLADWLGPFAQFDNYGMSMNDSGQVAFYALLDNGEKGIYLGSDPNTDRLIEVGDPLFGSTVTGLHFERFCMNNSGQIVFHAGLANGETVIVRADPVITTPVLVDSVNVVLGNHESGQLSDVDSSDDTRLNYSNGHAFSPTLPSLWLEFEGTLPTDSPNELIVILEAQVNSVGIVQEIEMYNYDTMQFETIDSRYATFNKDSLVCKLLEGDVARFVEPGTGAVKTKITYRDDGTAFAFNWRACIDVMRWEFN